jgi:pilus assembly protein CpaE
MEIQWLGLTDDTPDSVIQTVTNLRYHSSVQWCASETELIKKSEEIETAIVFLQSSDHYDVYQLCKQLKSSKPDWEIILVVQDDHEQDFKAALRSGAFDIVSATESVDQLNRAVEEAENYINKEVKQKPEEQVKQEGKVITICSPKGGVGKTTLTVNLASALSQRKLKVAVVDLDLQFGDVSLFFDAKPKRTIYEWVMEGNDSIERLKTFMTETKSNIHVMASPLRPEFSEVITGGNIEGVLSKLKEEYDVVLVDTPPFLVETVISSLEQSDYILLVTSMDLPTLKNNKIYIETIKALGFGEKIKVVLNRKEKVKGLEPGLVEKIVGTSIFAAIPNKDKVVLNSVNQGIPFVQSSPKSPVAKSVISIADQLFPIKTRKKKGSKMLVKIGGNA